MNKKNVLLIILLLVGSIIPSIPMTNAAPTKRQSCEGTYDLSNSFYGSSWAGQTFTTDNVQAHTVTSIQIKLRRSDAATTLYAYIFDVDANHKPTGSYKAKSGSYSTTPISGTASWAELTFASPPVLQKNTEYALVVDNAAGDSTHKIMWVYHSDDAYSGGYWLSSGDSGSTWTVTTSTDRLFMIYGEDATADITITSTYTGTGYIVVDGTDYSTPYTFTWTVGDSHIIYANTNRVIYTDVERKSFSSWSDSGNQNHTYTVTIGAKTVTANYHTEYKHIIAANGMTGAGLIYFNGTAQTAPYLTTWINSGDTFSINATLLPTGKNKAFDYWSDSNQLGRLHNVSPTTSANYTTYYASLPDAIGVDVDFIGNATIIVDNVTVTTPDTLHFDDNTTHIVNATAPYTGTGTPLGVYINIIGNATLTLNSAPLAIPQLYHFLDGGNHTLNAIAPYSPPSIGGGVDEIIPLPGVSIFLGVAIILILGWVFIFRKD